MFVLILIACIFLFLFNKKRFAYWRSIGIPQSDEQTFLLGDIKDVIMQRKALGQVFIEIYEKSKSQKLFGIYFSYRPMLLINDLEIAKNILTKDFHHFQNRGLYDDEEIDPLTGNLFCASGEKWKSLRQKVTPLFSSLKLKGMMPIIEESLTTLENFIGDGKELDVKDICARFTMTLISSIAFGIENDSINNPENAFNKTSLSILEPNSAANLRLVLGFFLPNLFTSLKISLFRPQVAEFYENITQQTINYRKQNSITRNDFIQLFMQLHDQGQLTLSQVTANAFIFVIAGYETTASSLTFLLYEIAKSEEIQRKIQEEIEGLEGDFCYEKLSELKFLEKCIEESLRKYPIVPMLNRVCEEDFEVKELGLTIPKGTAIVVPIIGFQRDPKIFENPLDFNPNRSSNSMTFGVGQRSCPGNRMAILVIKMTVVRLLSNFNLTLTHPQTSQLTFNPKIAPLASNEKISIKFTHR